jgi:UDP-glucose 4-epimerase
MSIVVTGGLGYIGSHVCVKLIERGFDVVALDDFSNAQSDVPDRIRAVTRSRLRVVRVNVNDRPALRQALSGVRIDGVVHLAGRKSVAESVRAPLLYYHTNIGGTVNVREAADGCPFVFSSSATVYGNPSRCPVHEHAPTAPVNPYGHSKLTAERVLTDAAAADSGSPTILLRYFNPVGAHPSGLIGDDPRGEPNNLMPRIERVAVGLDPVLTVHGTDYATRDGTAVRDYVHVDDIARAHVDALAWRGPQPLVANLGSASGFTVMEVVAAFERATGKRLPLALGPRRDGDVAEIWADARHAREVLGWSATRTLEEACEDSLRWRTSRTERAMVGMALAGA